VSSCEVVVCGNAVEERPVGRTAVHASPLVGSIGVEADKVGVERLRQHHDAFVELERVAFAVEVHFGDDVAR
jgi:hypothetical protein